MPEFKVVINDPEAGDPKPIPVKVRGVDDLKYTEDHKEGRKLVEAKINPKTKELIKAPYNIATLRIWKNRSSRERVNFTLKLIADNNVPEFTVLVPKNMLIEKLGVEETIGELFRAKAFQITVSGEDATVFIGKKIGDVVDASVVGIKGKKLLITGGSDFAGFPMIPTLPGTGKKALLLSRPPGFHPKERGERRRKLVRGNTISDEIVQINTKLIS
ncbi:MAG: 30S ribosomal protein S6e [Thermoprotei archaeon]|nr:MAG: 30S ribosomal protein S6e [Thermoprotei archaeon]